MLAGFESLSDEKFQAEIRSEKVGGIDSPWLEVLPEDIGSLYEVILEIYPKEEGGIMSLKPRTDRSEKGAVHTPVDLTKHQCANALKMSKIPPRQWYRIICCDIAHGGGAYTLSFARQVAKKCNREIAEILQSCVLGFDIDRNVLDVAAFCFHLEANCPTQSTYYHLYQVDSLNGKKARNFINSIISEMQIGCEHRPLIFIGNPPYGSALIADYENRGFESLKCGNWSAFFLEQAVRLAPEQGVVCQIVPVSIVHSARAISIRKFIQDRCSSIRVETYDVVPGYMFGQGKSTSSSSNSITIRLAIITMVVGQPHTMMMTSKYVRWGSEERDILFNNAMIRLNKDMYAGYQWPKIGSKETKEIFLYITKNERAIGSIVNKKGRFALYIANSPRYFISAVHKDLDRGQQQLHFSSALERDLAQVIICSDLFYWYWRVTEGEYSLTQKCLYSMPIPSEDNIKKHRNEIQSVSKRLKSKKVMESCYNPKENKGTKDNYKFDKNPKLMKCLNDLMHKLFDIKKRYHFHAHKANSIAEFNRRLETGRR